MSPTIFRAAGLRFYFFSREEERLHVHVQGVPWFREARIGEVRDVERPSAHHLCWPDLDVDLAVESFSHPDRYPLISRDRPRTRRTGPRVAAARKQPARRSHRR